MMEAYATLQAVIFGAILKIVQLVVQLKMDKIVSTHGLAYI